jgi:hypothetical protein
MFKAKPEKKITDKYGKKVIFLSQLPFGSSWKKNVNREDGPLMEEYQHRIRLVYLSTFFPLILMYIFFWCIPWPPY